MRVRVGGGGGGCRNKCYVEYYCVYVPKHGTSLNIMHGLGEAILNNKNNTNNNQDKLVSAVLFERNVKKDFVAVIMVGTGNELSVGSISEVTTCSDYSGGTLGKT